MPIYALGSERARIHPEAFVHPDAVIIGEVHLGAGASVWPSAVIRADNGPIYVGARTSVQDGAILHRRPDEPTIVGDDCVIGHLAHLEGCEIEDVVMVGTGSIVLENAVCRTVSVVGAGAVVRAGMEVPSGAMALGVPARLRPDVVTPEFVLANVGGYQHHIHQHRHGMMQVAVDECFTEDVGRR
jgi:carbonic anhydrase/acetyltransferase-like protein (isoleucine patch superfamily)